MTVQEGRDITGFEPAISFLASLLCLAEASSDFRMFHGITYNLDSFLEEEILARGHDAVAIVRSRGGEWLRIVWKSTRDQGVGPVEWDRADRGRRRPSEVRILHPHGLLLRENWDKDVAVSISFEKWQPPKVSSLPETHALKNVRDPVEFGIVLGQKDYNQLFGSLMDERNLLQLAAFERLCCLFYGVSFNDPNVDRLLELSARIRQAGNGVRPRPQHFALLRSAVALGPGQIDPKSWTAKEDLELREVVRLGRFGVGTLGTSSYLQQRRFVIDLLNEGGSSDTARRPN